MHVHVCLSGNEICISQPPNEGVPVHAEPGRPHWEAVKRVFRYLKGTHEHALTIGEGGTLPWNDKTCTRLQGYCDADWASQEHQHSMSGYIFTIDGGTISWSSKKQPVIALSTTEAKYIAMTHAAKEALWLRTFIVEITRPLTCPVTLYCNNQSAISISKNDQYHARTKHIDIRHHFIRDAAENRLLTVAYCPTAENLTDAFTKALPGPKLAYLGSLMGLRAA